MTSNKENKELCKGCSECCKYVIIKWTTPETEKDYDAIVWLISHENVSAYIDFEGLWHLEFKTRCKYLGKDDLCIIYEDRPDVCRKYTHKNCEKYCKNPYYYAKFDTKDDLIKYIKETSDCKK